MEIFSPPLLIPLIHPSLKHLLQQRLLDTIIDTDFSSKKCPEITLYSLKTANCVIYRSPIAFHLAKQQALSRQVAQQLNLSLTLSYKEEDTGCRRVGNREMSVKDGSSFLIDKRGKLEFTVVCTPDGWLEFLLDNLGLSLWLNYLPEAILNNFPCREFNAHNSMIVKHFLLQYTHARCCALLRLGHREGIIQLQTTDFQKTGWVWESPRPIPWFEGQFLLVHPSEQQLIAQIITVVDRWEKANPKQLVKLATDLSNFLLSFEKDCRIWGEVKQQTPKLSQVRLGLIAITLLVLRCLLEKLEICPLTEI